MNGDNSHGSGSATLTNSRARLFLIAVSALAIALVCLAVGFLLWPKPHPITDYFDYTYSGFLVEQDNGSLLPSVDNGPGDWIVSLRVQHDLDQWGVATVRLDTEGYPLQFDEKNPNGFGQVDYSVEMPEKRFRDNWDNAVKAVQNQTRPFPGWDGVLAQEFAPGRYQGHAELIRLLHEDALANGPGIYSAQTRPIMVLRAIAFVLWSVAAFGLIIFLVTTARLLWLRTPEYWLKRDRCPVCRYDLSGQPAGEDHENRCPECGEVMAIFRHESEIIAKS